MQSRNISPIGMKAFGFFSRGGGGEGPEEEWKYKFRPFPYEGMFDVKYIDAPHPRDTEWHEIDDKLD